MSLGVAILGGGIFAREEHRPAVEAADRLTLKAVYSRSLKSAKSLEVDENKVDLYSDDTGQGKSLDDLLARSDIQAVIIALPITKQPDYIRRALRAGKHVLSEKPIAENVQLATELLKWYRAEIDNSKITWHVAENYRFYNNFVAAAAERSKQGRILTFRLRQQTLVTGGKYFETEWRKTPAYQGGFLLDGGIHYIAGLRSLLGKDDPIVSVSAHTAQLQKHLPPLDTIEATARTKNGALGTISISFGTTAKGREYTIGSENGTVSVGFDDIVVNGEVREAKVEGSSVGSEVRAWSEALAAGTTVKLLSPEEALADLSLLEAILQSGEKGGQPVPVESQDV